MKQLRKLTSEEAHMIMHETQSEPRKTITCPTCGATYIENDEEVMVLTILWNLLEDRRIEKHIRETYPQTLKWTLDNQ